MALKTTGDAIAAAGLVEPGEAAPDFVLPRGPDGALVRFVSRVGGRPAVVVMAGGDDPTARALAARLAEPTDGGHDLDVHLVVGRRADDDDDETWLDETGQAQAAWGVNAATGPAVVVLDRCVRVVGVGPAGDVDRATSTVHGLVGRLTDPDRPSRPAPVLVVPDAIRVEMADRVRQAWQAADPVATGVETTADGRRIEALDGLRKRRRDHVVTEPALLRELTRHVGRRVIPQVAKAFAFQAVGFEGFKVGAYDEEDEGFFHAHRDNLSPATAHRRFALSLVLDDDHDGGELVFPEYGDATYRLAAREAMVFSGSLLHAVTPVTRGRRLVLLSFLFGGDRPA